MDPMIRLCREAIVRNAQTVELALRRGAMAVERGDVVHAAAMADGAERAALSAFDWSRCLQSRCLQAERSL
jgi:hypothetical protein